MAKETYLDDKRRPLREAASPKRGVEWDFGSK